MPNLKTHKVADIFPMMRDDEYVALKDDIRKNGQREPIWTYNGEIIDGRSRYKACQELGIEIRTKEYGGSEILLLDFVVCLHLSSKHLTSSQRAVIVLGIEEYKEEFDSYENYISRHPKPQTEFLKNVLFFGDSSEARLPQKLPKLGVVYALELGNGLVKIGQTIKPYSRINELKREYKVFTSIERVAISNACTNYIALEKKLHTIFRKYLVNGEFFRVDINDVVHVIKTLEL